MCPDRTGEQVEFCREMLQRIGSIPPDVLSPSDSWLRRAWAIITEICGAHLDRTDSTATQDVEKYTSSEVTAFLDMYMDTFASAFKDFRSSPLELKECEKVITEYIAEIEKAQATWNEHRNLSFARGQTQQAVGIILGLIKSRCDIPRNLRAVVGKDIKTATRMAQKMGWDQPGV